MKKYSKEQIQCCRDYLAFNVREGVFDEDFVREIEEKEDWEEVEKMMKESDAFFDALNQGGS